MKTRTLLLIAVAAVVTLSFTFATRSNAPQAKAEKATNEPIGGLASEGSF